MIEIIEDTNALPGKIICNICLYQKETDTFIGMILKDTIAFNGKR